jgi:phospholipase C
MPTGGSETAADKTLGGLIKDNQPTAFNLTAAKNGPAARGHFTCAMDGAARVTCSPFTLPCPKAKAAYGFVDPRELRPYLDLVHGYGWGNHFFQTNQGASFPAHQYLFGATSAPTANDDHKGIFAAENLAHPVSARHNHVSGCIAPPGATVALINPQGVEDARVYPCFKHWTLSDLLHTVGVSWRYYGASTSGIWMAPNAIKHICVAVEGQCTGKEFINNIEPNPSAVLSDILTKCTLRGVSWVTPDGINSDHSGNPDRTGGPSWVASIVNAVGTSPCKDGTTPYWDDTAILITWDDWGGWYDHVQPRIGAHPQGGYQLGFRVPLLVVSAYTTAGFIHNGREDFGSVVRFVEHNFGIKEGALTFADERATGDLREFFSLGNPPRTFQPISAPLSAQHFIDTPPSGDPPDDD